MIVRQATPADAPAIAAIHVDAWRGAYRGIVPAEYLAAPGRLDQPPDSPR
ncbi:MAG: hypothetical protein WD066_04185 [Planctomycetaceae bacterium]